jgi:hypothetical protein
MSFKPRSQPQKGRSDRSSARICDRAALSVDSRSKVDRSREADRTAEVELHLGGNSAAVVICTGRTGPDLRAGRSNEADFVKHAAVLGGQLGRSAHISANLSASRRSVPLCALQNRANRDGSPTSETLHTSFAHLPLRRQLN